MMRRCGWHRHRLRWVWIKMDELGWVKMNWDEVSRRNVVILHRQWDDQCDCELRLSIGQASLPHCIRLASQLSGGKGQKPETGEYLNDETTMKVIEDAHKGVSTFENSGVSWVSFVISVIKDFKTKKKGSFAGSLFFNHKQIQINDLYCLTEFE